MNESRFKLTSMKRFISSKYEKYLNEQSEKILKSLLEDLDYLCNDTTTGINIIHIKENLRNLIEYKKFFSEKKDRFLEMSINSIMLSISKSESINELYQLLYLIDPFLAEQISI
jgi:hypothetical protein